MTTVTRESSHGLLLDTSAAVALLVADHEFHALVIESVSDRDVGLAGHAWFETFSLLTRLPPGQRRSPAHALELLHANFPGSLFLDADRAVALGEELASQDISGGRVFDALVGAAARQAELPLLTADPRARPTYEALGVAVELIVP